MTKQRRGGESRCVCGARRASGILTQLSQKPPSPPPQQPREAAASTRGGLSKGKCAQAQIPSASLGSGIWKNEIKNQIKSRLKNLFIFSVEPKVDHALLSFFFSPGLYETQGSWVRKKTEWRSHAVYIRKASPGIRTGSRPPGATASERRLKLFSRGYASSHKHLKLARPRQEEQRSAFATRESL